MLENYELLPPDTTLDAIQERIFYLENAIRATKQQLKHAPKGALRISRSNGRIQYYVYTETTNSNGTYIPHEKMNYAVQLAQKAYNRKFLQKAEKQMKLLKATVKKYKCVAPEIIYSKNHQLRTSLIVPATLSDNKYAERWLATKHYGKSFHESMAKLFTSDGLRVRSKSEVMIAEALKSKNIPFKYELPVTLKSGATVYPDFCCLNLRTRKEIYWEHLGLLDDWEYCKKAILKLQEYSKSSEKIGNSLIITAESIEQPLSSIEINRIIELYMK